MEVDSDEKYLATGDINGLVKVWGIRDYCTNSKEATELITSERTYHILSSLRWPADSISFLFTKNTNDLFSFLKMIRILS